MLMRIAKYSIKNIMRNKFLSFSSVLVLTLLIFFINILVILHDVSFKLIDSINSKMTISLYLADWYDKNSIEVIDLIEDIENIKESKKWKINVVYKTKGEILDDIRMKEPDLVKILERNNPLPETIVLSNIMLDQYKVLNRVIENKLFLLANDNEDKDYFANYTSQYERITHIIKVLDVLEIWLYWIIIIFLISISIIIYSIIGNFIYYYRDEIYITRLVWWSNKFIYGPFVIQGSIYSFIAFVFSFLIFVGLLQKLNSSFWDMYTFEIQLWISMIEMIVFVIIWWFAWYLSSKKYLK